MPRGRDLELTKGTLGSPDLGEAAADILRDHGSRAPVHPTLSAGTQAGPPSFREAVPQPLTCSLCCTTGQHCSQDPAGTGQQGLRLAAGRESGPGKSRAKPTAASPFSWGQVTSGGPVPRTVIPTISTQAYQVLPLHVPELYTTKTINPPKNAMQGRL